MVRIAGPPPERLPSPIFHTLPTDTYVFRVFDPTRYGTRALDFRRVGPLHRFDHHRGEGQERQRAFDPERGIYYAALTLSGSLVEVFGDTGHLTLEGWHVARVRLVRDLRLLDLRGFSAMRAGSVAALAKVADRRLTQDWSRYFYENAEVYSTMDGVIYFNAHNDEEAIALYERAAGALTCADVDILPLDHAGLRSGIIRAALDNGLILVP